ncbi:L-rhamnose-binding lectin CSL3-like [Nelusetta ayraudi]|uniref:L-rhamnose-binding lectin CSL3-like n=1 Tax=Nelusetta ayraudi TaxID=303726 RepID=UPI003F71224C
MFCPLLIVLAACSLFSAGWSLTSTALRANGQLDVCNAVCDNRLSYCGQTVTCEGQKNFLFCGTGQALVIRSAIYGRHNTRTCSRDRAASEISNTSCGIHSRKVAEICNGKRTCSIRADNNMFGDPCVGTYKYLTVTYSCQRQSVTCERHTASLSCGFGHVLVIQSAIYGRRDTITCRSNLALRYVRHTGCGIQSNKVAEICNGQRNCSIRADNNMFGDPCVGTYKYLTVTYSCQRQSVTCEGHTARLTCDLGKVLTIVSAVYGRQDTKTCTRGRRLSQTRNTACANCTTSTVAEICGGKRTCSFLTSNSLFGDPCVGTFKYLTVSYSCD